MKLNPTDLGTPRRMFLVVLVVIALVLVWNLSKPWRTGVNEHHISSPATLDYLDRLMGRTTVLRFGTNYLSWFDDVKGGGRLSSLMYSAWTSYAPLLVWQFAPCTQTNLLAVTAQDARGEFASEGWDGPGPKLFGKDWQPEWLTIHTGQIILLRHATDTQTVYALEVVEQRNGTSYFRSRKILPAPR